MIYELDSSDGKEIEIPRKHRNSKTTEIEHSNGDRIVIEGDKITLYKLGGSQFIFFIPKPSVSKPTSPEPTV